MRRELWVKLAHRERFSASEIGIGLYDTVGDLFTIFCLVSAVFFSRRTVYMGTSRGEADQRGLRAVPS